MRLTIRPEDDPHERLELERRKVASASADAAALYRRLLGYVIPYWKGLAMACVAMACFAASETGFAVLMKPILDGGFVSKDSQTIRLIPLLVIGIFLVRGVAGFLSAYGVAWVGRNVVRDLRNQMFDQLLRLPSAFYDASSSGQLLSKLIYDVEQIATASAYAVMVLVRDNLTLLGLLAWMFYLNWQLALVILLTGPPLAYSVLRINQRLRRIGARIQTSMGDVTHIAEEIIESQRIVKIYLGQDYEARQFAQANEANQRLLMKIATISATNVAVIQLVVAGALAGVIFIATFDGMLEKISAGTFTSFIVALVLLLGPIRRLTNINVTVQRGIVAARSIFGLLDRDTEIDTGTRQIGRAHGAIVYEHVSFSYAADKGDVLNDIDITVEPGQTLALVGRSGSGKSSLVNLLPRFYEVQSGAITLDGQDIRSYKLNSLRDQIALVSQDVMLFNDTILHNIAYGKTGKVSEQEVIAAATAAHAMEFINQLPLGLHTLVGEKGVLLSGGQRQRLAIARALLKDAPILILDEATSSLDTESERYIQAGLERLMQKRTTLVIAHRLSTIEKADKIVVLQQGRIVEVGGHAELLAREGHYAALHKMQFRYEEE